MSSSIPINTYTGKLFDLYEATPDDIDIRDIAHALSLQCRFNGHCKEFYSVAEHCLAVRWTMRKLGYSTSIQMAALLHDAAEAYIGDVIKPLKLELPAYTKIEAHINAVISKKFDINIHQSCIKVVDSHFLWVEAKRLMNSSTLSNFLKVCGPPHDNDLHKYYMDCGRSSTLTEATFLMTFKELEELRCALATEDPTS